MSVVKFKKSWQSDQKSLALSLFGNHKKEFVLGQKLTYTKQRRNNKKVFKVKEITYNRPEKATLLKLHLCKE